MRCASPRIANGSAKRITFAHGPPKNRIRSVFDRLRSVFDRLVPFWVRFGSVLGPFFSKVCFLPAWGAQFSKTTESTFDQKTNLFDPQMASKRALFGIVFAPVGPLAVPIAFFSHLEPFRIPQTAHDLCIFSLRSPVNKNDRMHHTVFFVNFVAIDATFSFLVRFRSVLGPFWVHCKRFFSKCCFLPTRGAQFCKTASSLSTKQIHFLALRMATK